MNLNRNLLNNVTNRFLPIPENVSKYYECEPKITDFEFIKELGTGSFGRVFLASHKKTKVKYAIKAIDKKNKSNIEDKPYFRREIEIMYRIYHPNIVKLYGHFEDNNYCYFIMEYIPKGNVYSLIPKYGRKKQTHQVIASIIKDVLNAVYYLHNMNPPIIHRDIKPENILMNDNGKAILTDFGWSNYLCDTDKRRTVCGTPIYLAPEMINQKGHDGRVDIWCIGVLLFELVTGRVPFQGTDISTLKYNIRNMRIAWPSDINYEAKDLIGKILKYNPEERLNIKEILEHFFIKKYFPNAVNELILPEQGLKYRIFVVSMDDPQKWNPFITEEEETKKENNNNQYFPSNNRTIKRTNTMNYKNYKIKINASVYKLEKKNTVNNINKENNSHTINTYNDKYDKYRKYDKYNKQNNSKNKFEHNNSYTNYFKYKKYEKYVDNDKYIKCDKYDELLKKYENMKKDYYTLKKNYNIEIDKLKRELRDKEYKISQFEKDGKLYDFSERDYRRKKRELKELEMIYEDLKAENYELKERIKEYKEYIEEEEKKINYENNFNEIRNSINGRNKNNFKKAMDKLKYDVDEETQKNFEKLIKEKEKQFERYKEEENKRRKKEKEKFWVLINKYDRTLSRQEKENKDLKIKLKELENKLL